MEKSIDDLILEKLVELRPEYKKHLDFFDHLEVWQFGVDLTQNIFEIVEDLKNRLDEHIKEVEYEKKTIKYNIENNYNN